MTNFCETNALLRPLAYFRTGGHCQKLYLPKTLEELQAAVREIRQERLPCFLLGEGTNSLVWDEDWPGAVISLRAMQSCELRGNRFCCDGGVSNSEVAQKALQAGLGGAAWMYRLPGAIGATVRMNARCYGGEISQIVRKIVAVGPDGSLKEFFSQPGEKQVFRGYKDTVFMEQPDIVARVEMELEEAAELSSVEAQMAFCERDRQAQHQFDFPSCGCVFKNDYKPAVAVSSGLLLDLSGAKALKEGKAEVSSYHANFVYNKGTHSRDILNLTFRMRELVWQEFGVWLSYEMEILGRLPEGLNRQVNEQRLPAYKHARLAEAREFFQQKKKQF